MKPDQSYIRPEFGKYGPKYDYTGAHALTLDGQLVEIRSIYRREYPANVMASLRHFNGEDAGEHTLITLRILDRSKPCEHCGNVKCACEEIRRKELKAEGL